MDDIQLPDAWRDEMRTAWHRYVDMLMPVRPALYAYCRRLTGNIWDAEDLVQDSLLRAFGHLGFIDHTIRNPRGYLVRTATNVWIDELRRRERQPEDAVDPDLTPSPNTGSEASGAVRDAGARLLQRLSPQERAALVMKEVFDMTLDDIADVLATTKGAVKAALHRGRDRLNEPEGGTSSRRPVPSRELLDRFVDRYNAKDLKGLTALLLDGATVENIGQSVQFGRETFTETERNTLYHIVHGHPEWGPEMQPDGVRLECVELDGEPILLWFVHRWGSEALEVVFRFEEQEGRIARLRTYAFCPETMHAVAERLGVPVRTGLYRAPTPAPGKYWPEVDTSTDKTSAA